MPEEGSNMFVTARDNPKVMVQKLADNSTKLKSFCSRVDSLDSVPAARDKLAQFAAAVEIAEQELQRKKVKNQQH